MTGRTAEDILEGVREVLAAQFLVERERITRETTAMDIDGWDSVSHVYVMLEIEQRFAVTIRDDRVFDLANVGDLVDLLVEVTGAARPG